MSPVLASFYDAAFQGAPAPFFTYLDQNHGTQARLDHIFAHSCHSSLSLDTSVVPYSASNHSAIIVTFSDTTASPQLIYRINTTFLSYPSFHDSSLRFFTPFLSATRWDSTKILARSHAQDFAANANRRRHSTIKDLERQLASAHKAAARRLSDEALAANVQV